MAMSSTTVLKPRWTDGLTDRPSVEIWLWLWHTLATSSWRWRQHGPLKQ